MLLDDNNDDKVQIPPSGFPDLLSSDSSTYPPSHSPVFYTTAKLPNITWASHLHDLFQAVSPSAYPFPLSPIPEGLNPTHLWKVSSYTLPHDMSPDCLCKKDLASLLSHDVSVQL